MASSKSALSQDVPRPTVHGKKVGRIEVSEVLKISTVQSVAPCTLLFAIAVRSTCPRIRQSKLAPIRIATTYADEGVSSWPSWSFLQLSVQYSITVYKALYRLL